MRNVARACAGSEHDVFGRVRRIFAILALDDDLWRGRTFLETCTAFNDVDPVLLHQELDAARQLRGNAARALHDGIQVKGRVFNLQTEGSGMLGEVKHLSGAQQRLGRDAAPVEADAAKALALDDRRLHAELACADRGNVASGTGADDDEIVWGAHGVPSGLKQHRFGRFHIPPERRQPFRAFGAADNAVVAGQRDAHHGAG